MTDRPLALAPPHEKQRGAVASFLTGSVGECGHGIGLAVRGAERRRTTVDLLIATQRRVVH